ncbi:YjbF family lipoprotein [Planktotalea sp.]|uniref:YjbF family lipoprotein n=1 Tax=Planktotalea sp. TaxID=2029877 RepID=UPI0032996DBE
MIRLPFILLLSIGLTLAACGSERNSLPGLAFGSIKNVFSRNKQPPLTTAVLRSRLTPEVRAQIGLPVLIVELPKQKIAAVVIYNTENRGHITWVAPDGVAIYTKSGFVTGSRGVGYDLMSSFVDASLAIVTGSGTGQATRVQTYLDGENQQVVVRLDCHYTRDGASVYESCKAGDLAVENQYWLNKEGEVQSSRQWAGERNGYMLIESPIFAD